MRYPLASCYAFCGTNGRFWRSALLALAVLVFFVWSHDVRGEETEFARLLSEYSQQPASDVAEGPTDAAAALLQLHSDIAWQTLNRGALEKAEAMFRDILRRDPDRPEEIAGLAGALARQGKTDEAIELLTEAASTYPRNAKLASALGQAHLTADNTGSAVRWLRRARALEPGMPDVNYFLGSAYLRCQYPMAALRTFYGTETSRDEMEWVQDLGIGLAFGQLGLQCEASSYFEQVGDAAAGTPLADQAAEYHRQLDDALYGRDYLHGWLKVGERYDDNPGVIPELDTAGIALPGTPSAGNVYFGELSYDIVRSYNHDVTAGFSFLHTANYEAHEFDIVDNGVYLASVRRGYWRCIPYQSALRVDYDYLYVGSNAFSQRFGAMPSLTFFPTDVDSTTFICRYTLNDFVNQSVFEGTPFDLDGDRLSFGIVQRRQLCCRRLTLSGGYYYDHNFSEGANYDYNGHKAQLGLEWQPHPCGLRVSLFGEYYFRGYENPHALLGVRRDDDEYLMSVALTYPLSDDCDVSLQWNFDRNDSNLAINDYHHQVVDLAVEYRFGAGGKGQYR